MDKQDKKFIDFDQEIVEAEQLLNNYKENEKKGGIQTVKMEEIKHCQLRLNQEIIPTVYKSYYGVFVKDYAESFASRQKKSRHDRGSSIIKRLFNVYEEICAIIDDIGDLFCDEEMEQETAKRPTFKQFKKYKY